MDRLIQVEARRDGDGVAVAVPFANLSLAEGVHAASVGDDAVLLDIEGDAYHSLPDGAALCHRLSAGVGVPLDDQARNLIAAGLANTEPGRSHRPPPALPLRSVIHDHERIRVSDVGPAVFALAQVRRARRGRGLAPYLTVSSRATTAEADRVFSAARRFWTLLPYLPIEGECLVRSALLFHFLHHLGLRADWVFAVRLCPFSAHCWVQLGDVCLNDDAERLTPYTPIMVR